MSLGGSSSEGRTSSESTKYGYNQSNQTLDPTQAGYQSQMAQGFFGQGFDPLGNVGQGFTQAVGAGGLQQANQGAAMGRYGQNFAQSGMNSLQQFSQQNNPYLQQSISHFGEDLGRMFREEILPGIGGQFAQANQRGGSRQGVAEAGASRAVMDQFARGANDMRMQGYGMQQQAAGQLAGLGNQNAALGYQNQNAGYQNALQAGAQQGALAGQRYAMPFQVGGSMFGNPSTLTNSFGMDYATQSSTGRTDGNSFGIGFS